MPSVADWVYDELHDIVGFSEKIVAEFLVCLAEKSKSPEDLLRQISENQTIEINSNVVKFARELWSKVVTEKLMLKSLAKILFEGICK